MILQILNRNVFQANTLYTIYSSEPKQKKQFRYKLDSFLYFIVSEKFWSCFEQIVCAVDGHERPLALQLP